MEDLYQSLGDFTMDRPNGRNRILTRPGFGKFIREMCNQNVKRTRATVENEKGERPWGYRLPALGVARAIYQEANGVGFGEAEPAEADPRLADIKPSPAALARHPDLPARYARSLGFSAGVTVPAGASVQELGWWAWQGWKPGVL